MDHRKMDPRPYIEKWRNIARALGRSERWCQQAAKRARDPLPVYRVGKIATLDVRDLWDWLDRQKQPESEGFATAEEAIAEVVAEGRRSGLGVISAVVHAPSCAGDDACTCTPEITIVDTRGQKQPS